MYVCMYVGVARVYIYARGYEGACGRPEAFFLNGFFAIYLFIFIEAGFLPKPGV